MLVNWWVEKHQRFLFNVYKLFFIFVTFFTFFNVFFIFILERFYIYVSVNTLRHFQTLNNPGSRQPLTDCFSASDALILNKAEDDQTFLIVITAVLSRGG